MTDYIAKAEAELRAGDTNYGHPHYMKAMTFAVIALAKRTTAAAGVIAAAIRETK